MSLPWFRYYTSALHDPKVQRLTGDLFKGWVNILCIAAEHDGALPAVEDVAFALRITAKIATKLLDDLSKAGLLDQQDGISSPHNWGGRQMASDVSRNRVAALRERRKKQDVTVTPAVTPPSLKRNSNAIEQSRADTEQSRADAPQPLHDLEAVGAKACEAAGLDPGRVAVDFVEVQRWLTASFDLDRDILPSIRSAASRPGYQPPNSLKYFTKMIGEAHAARLDPMAIPAFLDRRNGSAAAPKSRNIVAGSPEDIAQRQAIGLTT